jgi:hypothetical protein
MMTIQSDRPLRAPHPAYDEERLKTVKLQMQQLGPPTIRIVTYADHHMAIEGCHRLAIAAELGIVPQFTVLPEDHPVETDTLGTDCFGAAKVLPAGTIAREFFSCFNSKFIINPNGTLTPIVAKRQEEE